ncbi:MAG: LamG-like jellyroll fold domain-containing protein [Bacteroidota bacterium]
MKTKALFLNIMALCLLLFNTITVKAQPSAFSLVAPLNGSYASTLPYFDWTNSTGATSYQLYVDGVLKKNNVTTSYYQLIAGEELTQGMHTWSITAVGTGNTQSNETWSFIVDSNPPTAFNLVSPANNLWTTSLQPTLSWSSSSDVSSGMAKYQLWIDGALNKDNIPLGTTSTTPTIALSNGSHTWEIRAIDNAGNVRNSTQNWTIKIDNLAPLGNLPSTCMYFRSYDSYVQAPNYAYFNGNFTIEFWYYRKFNSVDGGDGFSFNKNGKETLKLLFTNANCSPKISIGYNYQANSCSSVLDANTYINSNVWTHIAFTLNGTIGRFYINGTLVSSNNNMCIPGNVIRDYCFLGKDHMFMDEFRIWNVARSQSEISNNKDKSVLGCTPNLVAYWRFNEATGTVVYDQSNNNNNGTFIAGNGGGYANTSLSASSSLCNLKIPNDNNYISRNSQLFSWTSANDTGVGFQKYQLWIDGLLAMDNLSDTLCTLSNSLSSGSHDWFVTGFDSLGNNRSSNCCIFIVDNSRPNAFSLTTPTNNQTVSLPTPNLTWQATTDSSGGSGLSKYQLWINGAKNRDSIPISQTTVAPSSALPQGVYTWYIKAFDMVGNIRQSTQTWTFYVDWEAPTDFTLIEPFDNATLTNSRPLFKWHPSSDIGSGLDKYELCISGQTPIVISPTDTTYLLTFDLPNSNYTWYVKAYDVAGAFTSSNTHNLTIAVPLPTQASTPTGTNELCLNAANTDFTTTGATNATSYIWSITPSGAGTISGTGLIGTVDWNNTYTGIALIIVKGHNLAGDGVISASDTVTIYPTTIAGTISGGGTVCLGNSTGTLTLTGQTGNILKWQKKLNNGIWSDINNTISTYGETPLSVGVWKYRALVQSGVCTSLFSDSVTVNIIDIPESAGTINGFATVCQGQNSVIYTVPTITNATSYIWTLPSGATGTSSTNSITVNYGTSATSGNITVKAHNTCGDGSISTLGITVNPLPISAGTINGFATVCQGQNSVIYSVPTITNATSYIWTLPSGATGTSSTNSITVNYGTSAISGDITVKGHNTCGDGSLSTLAITVNPLPDNSSVISGLTEVCFGQNSVIYTVPTIDNATSYIWTLPSGATGTSSTNSITVSYGTSAISGDITVKGHNTCGDGSISTLGIIVNSLPITAGTINGLSTLCQGENSVIYTIPTITNATSYIWTLPSGATGASSTNSISVSYGTLAISGDITVKGHNTCGDGLISTLGITVNPLPTSASTINGLTTVCQGQNSVIYIVPTITNATSYIWTLPSGATGTSSTNSITVSYGTSAIYGDITVKGHNTCGDGITSTLPIVVNTIPTTPIIILTGNNVLHSDATIGNQWYNQSGIINGAINQNYPAISNGDYYVIVTTNGCSSDTSNTIHIINTGISSNQGNKSILVYPNPVSNELTLEIEDNTKLIYFEILNSIGQVIFKGDLLNKTTVETSTFAPGVYLIKLENGELLEFKKIIKE